MGVWNGWVYGIAFSRAWTFRISELKIRQKIALSAEFQGVSCKIWPLKMFLGLWMMVIPHATNPYPHEVPAEKVTLMGHTPSTAGAFRRKFRKNSGKTPETLSERFLEFPSRVRLGCPKPYNSRHSRLPERFQNALPPSTAGDASFFRIGSGEGLAELVMEFPAVLGVFLILSHRSIILMIWGFGVCMRLSRWKTLGASNWQVFLVT